MVSIYSVLCVLGACAAGYLLWSAYCYFDSRREERRKYVSALGLKCSQRGAKRLANACICYGAGDYSGLFGEMKHWRTSIHNGIDVIEEEFQAIASAIAAEKAKAVAAVAATVAAVAPTQVAGFAG